MLRIIVTTALLIGATLPAAAEPITLSIAAAALAAGLPSAVAFAIADLVVTAAIAVGVSLGASSLRSKPSGSGGPGNLGSGTTAATKVVGDS